MSNFKIIFGILCIFILFVNCGEKERVEITSRHENGQKKTLCKYRGSNENEIIVERIEYDDKGRVLSEENLPGKTKRIIYWGEKGNKDGEGIIKNGIKNGKFLESCHKNGRKREEVIYANGEPQKVFYWDDQGTKIGEGSNVKGLKSGKFIEWHTNGQKKAEAEYKDEKIIEWIEWDENSTKMREVKIVGNAKHEYKAYWHSEGEKKFKLDGFYVDGRLKKVRGFDQIKKILEVELDGNQQISKVLLWYNDGKLWKEEEYKNGKLHGKKTYYWEDKKISFREFRNGKPFGRPVLTNNEHRGKELDAEFKNIFNDEIEVVNKIIQVFKKN